MLNTYGTRPLSWYAEQAPDELWGEEGGEMAKKSWVVTMKCTVTKQVTVENCTEEEAAGNPFDFAVDEVETEQIDWEVIDVQENR